MKARSNSSRARLWLGVSLLSLVACASEADSQAPAKLGQPLVTFSSHELIGRPTATSVSLKAIASSDVELYIEYGTAPGSYGSTTATQTYANGQVELEVTGLTPDTVYYYRMRHRLPGSGDAFAAGSEHRLVTQRARTSSFVFDVQSDSHQGYPAFYSDQLYGITMQNMLAEKPDFLFDLGDAISTDDSVETAASVQQKYLDQRTVLETIGHSSPVFLVLGNHENEEGWNLDDTANVADSLPVLGANSRKSLFLNPVPNGFYSGNTDPHPAIQGDHLRGDYYAFEWGSALFVAIDPFWYTMRKPFAGTLGGEKDDEVVGDRWDWTLGREQYDWLESTLAASNAPFKFVFAHHEVGGNSDYARAGVSGAKYGEWGGYDPDGTTKGFAQHRPGWPMPIHQLLVKYGVSIFFHGHDHIFAKEDLDNIVYQECPHAANANYGSGFATNAEDYADGDTVNNSGHLRVSVEPAKVTVSYVRSFLPRNGGNGRVDYTYTLDCTQNCPSSGQGGAGGGASGGSAGAAGDAALGGTATGGNAAGGGAAGFGNPSGGNSNTAGSGNPSGGSGNPSGGSGNPSGGSGEKPSGPSAAGQGETPGDGATGEAGQAGQQPDESSGGSGAASVGQAGEPASHSSSKSTPKKAADASGCGCSVPGSSAPSNSAVLALLVAGTLLGGRRSRSRRARSSELS